MRFISYNHQELEPQILTYWQTNKVVEKLREKNKQGKPFYFLDGPPYTSGRIHLGHAWNKALKDLMLRYKRMQGHDVWDRAGFDMHGLPTEHKVMAKFNLKNKDDIKQFGYEKFSEECYNFCTDMMNAMITDFQRIGTTLNFSNPDQPIKRERMSAVWGFIKKAHENKRLYLGKRTLHWDPIDQSALAKHELEYKKVTDTSIYVKFPHKEKTNTFFVIWTTTPWTIPLNLAIMVNPTLTYIEVKVGNEIWILAKELAGKLVDEILEQKMEVVNEFLGKDLVGQYYTHPLQTQQYFPKELQKNPKLFSVLASEEYVTTEAGTGLVHCAPGCGPEDYEVGYQNAIPPFNCVGVSGHFESFGQFTGWQARVDDQKFIEALEGANALVAKRKYTHDYPHAERSKAPIIFRTTPQWFLKVVDIKKTMIENNEAVHWNPEAGKNAFRSWLENLRDNSITKQRFWGTPVPIWQAEDGEIIVIGSVEELEQLAENVPENIHKPWIDKVVINKNGKVFRRLPDVLDVWIDPGCQSWIMLQTEENMQRYYPPNYIVEGKDQIRAWFNLLWVCSHLSLNKPSFQNVFMHGFVTDVDGVKMSKSLGNIISPYEIIDKHGADVLRYYLCQTSAGEDINFSWNECVTKERNLHILWNIHKFLITSAKELGCNPAEISCNEENYGVEEQYILSKLHSTIKQVTELLDSYHLDEIIVPLEELFLELSRTYMQFTREKSSVGEQEEKELVLSTIYTVFLETIKMFQIIAPFVCEAMYLNLKEAFNLTLPSISHYAWPKVKKDSIDRQLEQEMESGKQVIQAILHAREQGKLGVRWPVKEVVVVTTDAEPLTLLTEAIKNQTNTKELIFAKKIPGVKLTIKPNYKKIGPKYGELSGAIVAHLTMTSPETITNNLEKHGSYHCEINETPVELTEDMLEITQAPPEGFTGSAWKQGWVYLNTARTPELDAEGFAREITRKIQDARKQQKLEKTDRIAVVIQCSETLKNYLTTQKEMMQEKVGAPQFHLTTTVPQKSYTYSTKITIRGEIMTLFWSQA